MDPTDDARQDEASRLAREFRDGREEAFPELVELLRERLYRVAFRLTGTSDDAMDVVQDAFVKVYKDIGAWNERSAFYSWLYRVATNLAIDRLRRRKKDRELANGAARERAYERDSIAELVDARETEHELRRLASAVAGLPEGQRTIVTLRHYEGLSLKEISEVRGVALGTVKSTLHQAFRSLQRALGVGADSSASTSANTGLEDDGE
ncbi:MAG TPA: RNA polymerase sigma factor [Planctomycetota bacterium]|nr:RNA polymerase sigma factor [Planctomycetota bacterium]